MSVGETIFLLAAIWCTIHALHYFSNRRTTPILPTLRSGNNNNHGVSSNWHRSSFDTKVSLHTLQLKMITTKWNIYHDKLSSFLSRRKNKSLGLLLRRFYDVGSILGVLGMFAGVGGLLWMFAGSLWTLLQQISTTITTTDPGTSDIPHLVKRILVEDTTTARQSTASRFTSITPVIPGVTVPLSDLPVIVLAVFISQIVHELGHAIAAAHESIPMISGGLSFTVCIPAAFVSFPASGMKNLLAKGRSRVIAAGPFHNLVFWCFLMLLLRLQVLDGILFFSGYKNVSTLGKAVIGVSVDSPLSLHLSPGSIITQLDDEHLGNRPASDAIWSDYLAGKIEKSNLGWCVAKSDLAKSNACCSTTTNTQSPFLCFVSHDMTEKGCIDPVPIMTKPKLQNRCDSSAGCPQESTCVIPQKNSRLTRIMVHSPEDEATILWNGPSLEIWQEVEVSNWLPRIQLLPLGFPSFVEAFWNYLTMATFSLYLFNLLPLPHLDGSELLSSILDWIFEEESPAFSFDVEALENGADRTRVRRRWKDGVMKFVPMSITLMVVWCIIFWTANAMR